MRKIKVPEILLSALLAVQTWLVTFFLFIFLLHKKVHDIGTSYKVYGERVKTETGLYDPVVI